MRFKRFTYIFIILLFLSAFSVGARNYNVHGGSNNITGEKRDYSREIYDELEVEGIKNAVPDNITGYIGSTDLSDSGAVAEKLSLNYFLGVIKDILGDIFPSALKALLPVFAVIILSLIAGAYKDSISSEPLASALEFALVLCFSGVVFLTVRSCFTIASEFLDALNAFMTAAIPVMGTLTAASGSVAAAAANSSGMFILLNVINIIANQFLMPVLQICFALSLASHLSPSVNLSGIAGYIRSVFMWVFIFIMTLLVTVLVYQNILASSADTIAARTVKFTASSFIPVVGGVLGDATRTVIGSLQAVKSAAGIFGVIVVIVTLLPPLLTVAVQKFVLQALGALAKVFAIDREAGLIGDMCSLLDLVLAVMISLSVVAVFALTIFINTTTAM